ncbi:NACHT domain-containing protein [Kitasatospora sp. NPDC058965]|uniref:NACHT domain-containing protein n=1 Tax=Kitasatospora sp. NPDC058965 TaxID=3346682 RepID=UPI0036A950B8
MTASSEPSPGRAALRDALVHLEGRALRGRHRSEVIAEAGKRCPELPKLSKTTVGNWFQEGVPAKDFAALWALVDVLLDWSHPSPGSRHEGVRTPTPSRSILATPSRNIPAEKALWHKLWEQASGSRPAPRRAVEPHLGNYLAAAREAATVHPYPGVLDLPGLPALSRVYVRQQARTGAVVGPDAPTEADGIGLAIPAERVFTADTGLCFLVAGPGGGKSSLLRAHLAESTARWLDGAGGKSVPVVLPATALTGSEPLPAVIAKAVTAELVLFGLLAELTADTFRRPPHPRAVWLVLVDGLDELPSQADRSRVLRTLSAAAKAGPEHYRFVVATRPLPPGEVEQLDAAHFELQPFSPHELRSYAANWFSDLDDPVRHTEAFTAALERSRLDVLARTPLVAVMLCQLYRADPARPLPEGRTGAYRAFVDLVYRQNTHKSIRQTHEQAVRTLAGRHQVAEDLRAAEQAARHVCDHLPALIDRLAHERFNGTTTPTLSLLAELLPVPRPAQVTPRLWLSFLGDLLRPVGLLTQRGDEFDFLHQSLLEYQAACHATRDEQARRRTLDTVLPREEAYDRLQLVADRDASYFGFLLDGLLTPTDAIAVETLRRLDTLVGRDGVAAGRLIAAQVELRTNLPTGHTVRWLTRIAGNADFHGYTRVHAAVVLTGMTGHQHLGARMLADLAVDTGLDGDIRSRATDAWIRTVEVRPGAPVTDPAELTLLTALAQDATLDSLTRVRATDAWIQLAEGQVADPAWVRAAAELLARVAQDTTLHHLYRGETAGRLAGLAGSEPIAAAVLAKLAKDTSRYIDHRMRSAEQLAGLPGHESIAAEVLVHLAADRTLPDHARIHAADTLADLPGAEPAAAEVLIRLAEDTGLAGGARVEAAQLLSCLRGQARESAELLAWLAVDTALVGTARVRAAETLAELPEHEPTAVGMLTGLALGTECGSDVRVAAASGLAWVPGHELRGAALLSDQAQDPALDTGARVEAAACLAQVAGHERSGTELLTGLARDATHDGNDRVAAAEYLAWIPGHDRTAADLLARIAGDSTVHTGARIQAVNILSTLPAHRRTATTVVARLAADATLAPDDRVDVAECLAWIPGHDRTAADLLAHIAGDGSLNNGTRIRAAEILSAMPRHRRAAAGVAARLARDAGLLGNDRERAADLYRSLAALVDHGAARAV